MQLSCLPVSYFPEFRKGLMSIGDWARQGRRLALDAVDLSVLMTRPLDAERLRATARELRRIGMPVDTIATYTDFTHPDSKVREDEFAQFQSDIAAAAFLGAKFLRITAGQAHPETSRPDGIARTVEYFSRAAEFASRNGVGLLFENHSKPGVWRHFDFGAETEVYFELLERLRAIRIDLQFDTANACFYRQDPVRMLEGIFPRVRRIHVADIAEAVEFRPVLVGTGIVPLGAVFRLLKARNYSGGLAVEEASFTGFAGIAKAVAHTRSLWAGASVAAR